MLLDRYTASYYQSRGKLKSLIIKHKLEIQSDVGILIAEYEKDFAGCLDYYRSDIWRSVQTITDTYKVKLIIFSNSHYELSKAYSGT